jgi:hypothetical protein
MTIKLPVREQETSEMTSMAFKRTSFRNFLTRGFVVMALLYGLSFIGASALLLGVSSTSAYARGGHGGFHGGRFYGGGFRGLGWGLGPYPYGYYGGYYPYYGDAGVCYVVRQRVMTRYGWRIRRVSICE